MAIFFKIGDPYTDYTLQCMMAYRGFSDARELSVMQSVTVGRLSFN